MAWYAVYEISNGNLISVGTRLADNLNPLYSYKELSGGEPDFSKVKWDNNILDFVPVDAPTSYFLTRFRFLQRLTDNEKALLFAPDYISGLTDQQKIFLKILGAEILACVEVDLLEPRTITAVNTLVTWGIITQQRADEILSTTGS